MKEAVGELVLSAVLVVIYWPGLTRAYWRDCPDNLAPAIALLLELAGIAGLAHALRALLT